MKGLKERLDSVRKMNTKLKSEGAYNTART